MTVFAELAGQETVVAQLENAVAGAMTHAWLFTGPPGSGRSGTSTVVEPARSAASSAWPVSGRAT